MKRILMLSATGRKKWRDVEIPDAAFAWLPFTIERIGRKFRPDPAWRIEDLAPAGKAYYVATDGDDGATGLDAAHPLRKVSTALNKADVVVVRIAEGVYSSGFGWDNASPARNISVYGTGSVIVSPHLAGLTWTAVDAHYTAPMASCQYVLDASIVDANGDYQVLTKKTSAAEVDATPGSWYFLTNTVYVHTSDGRAPDANVWPYITGANGSMNDPNTQYIEGVKFYGGSGPFVASESTGTPLLYFKNCEFKYGYSGNGLGIVGFNLVICQDCRFSQNKTDGLNIAEGATIYGNLVLINPTAYSNGIVAAITNGNGYSRHDRGCTVIIGGEMWNNSGPQIYDVNTGTGGPTTWVLGTHCYDGYLGSGAFDFNFGCGGAGAMMWLDSCDSDGSTTDLNVAAGGSMYYRDLVSGGVFANAGVLETYTADADLDYLFDQGSLSTFVGTDSRVRITPRKHWNNQWVWFAVRSEQWAGKIPHFLVAKADRFSAPGATENLAFWSLSPDTDSWTAFDNQATGASDIEFYHNTAFPVGNIYVAYLPMAPTSRVDRLMGVWDGDARVTETASTTGLVIDTLTAQDNGDGRTAPALPVYGFKLTNPSGYTKNKMILTAYVHPNETTGFLELEGALAWLLGGSAAAEMLLDYFEVYVYPCLNPQGVWGGWFRSSPETPASDNNRIWDTTGTNEAVDLIKAAMAADTGGAIEVGIDFHSSTATYNYLDAEDHTATLYAAFIAKMAALDAGFTFYDETVATMLRYLWQHSYSAALAGIVECGIHTSKGPADFKNVGQYAMRALAGMLAEGRWTNNPGVGSRSFNGSTDRIDWAAVSNLTGHALTISLWVYLDSLPVNGYMVCLHAAGDADYGMLFNCNTANGNVNFVVRGSTDLNKGAANGTMSTGAWTHLLVTWNGTMTDNTTVHIYKNGTEVSYLTNTNGAAEVAAAGSWSLGGRIYSDTRNLPGDLAQVRVFDRVLAAGEIALEAGGDVSTASGLVFWFKGNTSSLAASPGGTGTADGTTSVTGVGNGPAIIYP